jgi:1-acyl-sn-glycerol-3-phosphate acyltransferase
LFILHFIRSLIYAVWVVGTLIPYAIVVLIAQYFVKPVTLYWMCVGFLRLCVGGARVICGVKYRVTGMQHVPSNDALASVILCPKHQSTWETFAFPTIMSHPLAYVFKKEILKIPFFGWSIGRLDFIHIDRSNRMESWNKVATQGERLLNKGVWVIMFPEGTRTQRGGQGPYKSGATRLAVTTGKPVVPIAVSSAQCWPRKSFILKPGTIDVVIGPPIASVGREPDELMREVETWIEAEMRRLDPEAYAHEAAAATARAAT